MLAEGGLDPTFVIGGRLKSADSNARLGTGRYLVAEADESDASFLHLQPMIAVVTNIDNDHLGTLRRRLREAAPELHRVPAQPAVLRPRRAVPGRRRRCARSLPTLGRPVLTYGFGDDADVRAVDVRAAGRADALRRAASGDAQPLDGHGEPAGPAQRAQRAGGHRRRDRARRRDDADRPAALLEFPGHRPALAAGTASCRSAAASVTLVDDYGHHPTEIAATLDALRAALPGAPPRGRVPAAPLHAHARPVRRLRQVLSQADALLVSEVYAAGEAPIDGADGRAICRAVRSRGEVEPVFVPHIESVADLLRDLLRAGRRRRDDGRGQHQLRRAGPCVGAGRCRRAAARIERRRS